MLQICLMHGKTENEVLEWNFSWKKNQRTADSVKAGHTPCVTASGTACRVLIAFQLIDHVLSL